jgi:ATP-binding cassette subfamily F protein 3
VLAGLFLKRCNMLLLDEPTNHLDIESREALVAALQKFSGALVIIAHDRWLLSQTGAEIWELGGNGLTRHEDFAAWEASRRISETAAEAPPGGAALSGREEQRRLRRKAAEKRNALHKEIEPLRTRYTALETELERVLAEQDEVETLLADPLIYADNARAGELLERFEAVRRRAEDILSAMSETEEKMTAVRGKYQTPEAAPPRAFSL